MRFKPSFVVFSPSDSRSCSLMQVVAGMHSAFLKKNALLMPERIMDDRAVEYMDVDPLSSDSELEDILKSK